MLYEVEVFNESENSELVINAVWQEKSLAFVDKGTPRTLCEYILVYTHDLKYIKYINMTWLLKVENTALNVWNIVNSRKLGCCSWLSGRFCRKSFEQLINFNLDV